MIVVVSQLPLLAAFAVPAGSMRWGLVSVWAVLKVFVLWQMMGPRGRLFGPVVWRTSPQPRVALTFDDGPHPEDTPAILEILKSAGANATFFVVGEAARCHPDLVKRASLEGHEVASHSDTHPWWFSMATAERVRREVRESARTIESLTGRRPLHFRPPVGHRSFFLGKELASCGMTLVTWSSRCFDTLGRSPAAIRRAILATARPGGIVMLHEGVRRPPGETSPTVAALPGIIEALRARGLEPVSLEDLRAARPARPQAPVPPPSGAARAGHGT